tara:strand:+ start:1164 stop:1481 length:318 start_codon:yes stop_codon:yes gene_type:complete
LKINIFNLILVISLNLYSQVFADLVEVELSNTNDLKCRYHIELDHNIINSKIDCRNYFNKKDFIEGWDKKSCKSENYSFTKDYSTYEKVAIYCLTLDEKKYIQVY